MDTSLTFVSFIAALLFVTVSSDCNKNGCGGGGGGGGGGSRRGFGGGSFTSFSSSFPSGPSRVYNVPARGGAGGGARGGAGGGAGGGASSHQASGPGWQASYRTNADGSWSRQSSWNSNGGYSSSKAALAGFHTRDGNRQVGGGQVTGESVQRTGVSTGEVGGGRVSGGAARETVHAGRVDETGQTGGGVGQVVGEIPRGRNGGSSVVRTGGGSSVRTSGGAGPSVVRTGGGAAGGATVVRTGGQATKRVNGGRNGGGRVRGVCGNAINSRNQRVITGYGEQEVARVSSCNEIVTDYPSLCSMLGSIGGDCCRACRSIGSPNCLDQLSAANAITFQNGVRITNCSDLAARFKGLCSTYGGPGSLCCHSCRDYQVETVTVIKGEAVENAGGETGAVGVSTGQVGRNRNQQVQSKGLTDEAHGRVDVVRVKGPAPDESRRRVDEVQSKGPTDEARGRVDVVQEKGPAPDESRRRVDEVQSKGPTGEARRRVDRIRTKGTTNEARRRVDQVQSKGPIDETRGLLDEAQTKGPVAESRRRVDVVQTRTNQFEKGLNPVRGRPKQVANTCVDRVMARMQSKGPGITCADFVARDPCHCLEVADECCASCARVDLNQADCVCRDTLSQKYPYYVFVSARSDDLNNKAGATAGGNPFTQRHTMNSCSELLNRFPSFCAQVGGPGQSCCRSCKAADIRPAQTCTDRLSEDFPIILSNNETITDCRILRRDYTQFCEDYGGPGGDCCHSCQGVDLSCVDNALRWWRIDDGKMMRCREFVHANPCNCQRVRGQCCKSCKDVDLSQCKCRDTLSHSTPYMVRNLNTKGDIGKQRITSCAQIARDFPEACTRLGGEGHSCCSTCSRVDFRNVTCKDKLSSTHSLTFHTRQSAYSCPGLLGNNLALCTKPFIGQDNKGVCCFSCRHGLSEEIERCEDDPAKTWFSEGEIHTCKTWVKKNPCRCQRCQTECCDSCKSANTCFDRLPTEVAEALGVGSCPDLVKDYPEMCADVSGACCASCREQKQIVDDAPQQDSVASVEKTPQLKNVIVVDEKQSVGGGPELYEFKGPILEMKSEVLDAYKNKMTDEFHGSVSSGIVVDDHTYRKVTFVNEHGPVDMEAETVVDNKQPDVIVEWDEEYIHNKGPVSAEVNVKEDEVVVDSQGPSKSLLEYYDYGGSPSDRETVEAEGPEEEAPSCVDRELGTMQSKGPGITCQDFVARDPCNCHEVKKECCASCAGVVLTPERCSCRDLLSSVYPYYVYPNGMDALTAEEDKITFTSCYDLINRYPNFCDELGKSGQSCCSMCRRAHIEPDCMDKLSAQYPLLLNGKPVDDCRLLARDYKDQCLSYGGQGQACCRSCQSVGDLSCVDDSLMYWEENGVNYNCRDYVHLDPCRCLHVSQDCCDSCRQVDTRRCQCQDSLSASNVYYVTHFKPDGSEDRRETVTTCSIIVRDYPQFCRELGGQGNTCCRACEQLKHLQSKGPSG